MVSTTATPIPIPTLSPTDGPPFGEVPVVDAGPVAFDDEAEEAGEGDGEAEKAEEGDDEAAEEEPVVVVGAMLKPLTGTPYTVAVWLDDMVVTVGVPMVSPPVTTRARKDILSPGATVDMHWEGKICV